MSINLRGEKCEAILFLQCEAPVRERSVGEHNSNVTMVYGTQITYIVTGAYKPTNITGGPHIVAISSCKLTEAYHESTIIDHMVVDSHPICDRFCMVAKSTITYLSKYLHFLLLEFCFLVVNPHVS